MPLPPVPPAVWPLDSLERAEVKVKLRPLTMLTMVGMTMPLPYEAVPISPLVTLERGMRRVEFHPVAVGK